MTMSLHERALRCLAQREHSRTELAHKLGKLGSEEEVDAELDRLTELGLLSDVRFADAYVRAKAARFGYDFSPGEEVSARLEQIGRDPAKIERVVTSHLHFDHSGGNGLIPNAELIVQQAEWEVGTDPERGPQWGLDGGDLQLGHPVRRVAGEHDVFGDGRVVCIPTPGHTPGHQSLRVRLDGGEVVLAGDACYFCQTLRERRLPARVYDRPAMHASLERLAELERGGARIIFGHDPVSWRDVPQAPAEIAF